MLTSLAALLSVGWWGCAGAPGQEQQKVEITGGADASQNYQWYKWKVTNRSASPIVYVQFPHYHGDSFDAPTGWDKEATNIASAGVEKPGTFTASVARGVKGIKPGRSAEFSVRIARSGAYRRPGKVTVRFADGSQEIVAGVEVPSAPSTPERLVALIGFAMIFVILVLVRRRRRQKDAQRGKPPLADPPAPGG